MELREGGGGFNPELETIMFASVPTILLRVLTLTGLVTGGQCQSVRQESRRVGLPMYQTIVSYITQASLGNT